MPLCRSVLVLSPIGSISLSYNGIKWNIIDKMLRLFQTPAACPIPERNASTSAAVCSGISCGISYPQANLIILCPSTSVGNRRFLASSINETEHIFNVCSKGPSLSVFCESEQEPPLEMAGQTSAVSFVLFSRLPRQKRSGATHCVKVTTLCQQSGVAL